MDRVIESMENAFVNYNPSKTDVRKREGFQFDGSNPGVLEWMPVYEDKHATIKIVSYAPKNPSAHNLPTIISTSSLYDTKTGHLCALADATFLTAVRTGAASAIVSKILAKDDSEVIGIVGCGCQAVVQLHALSRCFNIKKVYAYDVDESVANSLKYRTSFLKLNIQTAPREALEAESDIICTATSVPVGEGPVLSGENLKSHVHINLIGADLPGKIEIPLHVLRKSLVCPDFLPQAVVEGECQQLTPAEIGPDIIKLAKNPERFVKYKKRITVFDSTGFALQDQVALNVLLELSKKYGYFKEISIESIHGDPKNPYYFPLVEKIECNLRKIA